MSTESAKARKRAAAPRRPTQRPKQNPVTSMKFATLLTTVIFALGTLSSLPSSSQAASAAEIDRDAKATLNALYASNPTAQLVGKKAKAILVFPRIIKGGFMVGAQHGDGALLVNGKTAGYYNTVAASYGFQAGIHKFGCAMFLMTDASLNYLRKSCGIYVVPAPRLGVVHNGLRTSLHTPTP